MPSDYYLRRKNRLLKDFHRVVNKLARTLGSRYGHDMAKSLVAEVKDAYEQLIPRLPDVGGVQPLTQFVIATGWFLAMYTVLGKHGIPLQDAGPLVYDLTADYLRMVPRFARRLLGGINFTPRYLSKLRRRAEQSQQRVYPDGYVFEFVTGKAGDYDYGVDYVECATCKFLAREGAFELAPYLCAVDYIYSEMLGWGLVRTTTLAEGGDRCDFRFTRGGKTRIASSVMGFPMRED